MTEMTGGTAIVQSLLAHDVKTIFGLPGAQNDWFYNALYDAGDRVNVIHTRHEQGAGYMALGAAMSTGDPAVYAVVPGVGMLNASSALATAYSVNAPVFCFTGQISHQHDWPQHWPTPRNQRPDGHPERADQVGRQRRVASRCAGQSRRGLPSTKERTPAPSRS